MPGERFKPQEKGAFLEDCIYDRVMPAGHFLRKLEDIAPWERLSEKLLQLYCPWPAVWLLKRRVRPIVQVTPWRRAASFCRSSSRVGLVIYTLGLPVALTCSVIFK